MTGIRKKFTANKEEFDELMVEMLNENERLERSETELIKQRDYWETKATELADDVARTLGFEIGEHNNCNCPVQNAIDGFFEMSVQIEEWRNT